MKIVHLILSVFLVGGGCSDPLRLGDNDRLVHEGTVVDQDGNPLQNISVYGMASEDDFEKYNLGIAHTDASGHFRLVSLKPENRRFYVVINRGNLEYASVRYENIPGSAELFAQLPKMSVFELTISKTSTGNDDLSWRLTYTYAGCGYIFNENGVIDEENSYCHPQKTETGNHYAGAEDYKYPFYMLYGTAQFTYQINDQPKQSIELTIDQPQESYVFEY